MAASLSGSLLIFMAVVLTFVRVYSGHHTVAQVCAGAVGGITWAQIWFAYLHMPLSQQIQALFQGIGEKNTLLLLCGFSLTGILILGPVERRWKESFRAKQRAQAASAKSGTVADTKPPQAEAKTTKAA